LTKPTDPPPKFSTPHPNSQAWDGCVKVGTWVVGDLSNHTCDPVRCATSYDADKCAGGLPGRTDRVLKLYDNPSFTSDFKLEAVRLRCPEEGWKNAAPFPLPFYVPQSSTMPDIHPGEQ